MTDLHEPVAILGIGLRFPGADDPAAFWKLLAEGHCAIGERPSDRHFEDSQPTRGGFIDGVDWWDWRAFRVSPREARQMDPQHRLLLECAWNAVQDAGIPFDALPQLRASVFAGLNFSDYQDLLTRDPARVNGYTVLGNVSGLAPNRISHFFGLTGPSIALNAACSSSLAAVHYACQSLRTGEADLALACGAELMLSATSDVMLREAGVLSRSGTCRALDERADGYVRGEGVAVLVLCRASSVTAEDRVYGLIRGSAVNHNGTNEWLMATSAAAQERVIREACRNSGVAAESIGYVELHGSALPKGDAAEVHAVGATCGPCRIGSVTNSIGYLGAAGGMAGLIKLALSLHHEQLPPTIGIERPLAELRSGGCNLEPQLTLERWQVEGPALGGVLSTSLGGANAFVVLESAPPQNRVGKAVNAATQKFKKDRLWPEWLDAAPSPVSPATPACAFARQLQRVDPSLRVEMMFSWIQGAVREILGIGASDMLDRRERLLDLGLNSLALAQLGRRLAADLNVVLPVAAFFEHPTLEALSAHVAELVCGAGAGPVASPIEEMSEAEAEALLLRKIAVLERVGQ